MGCAGLDRLFSFRLFVCCSSAIPFLSVLTEPLQLFGRRFGTIFIESDGPCCCVCQLLHLVHRQASGRRQNQFIHGVWVEALQSNKFAMAVVDIFQAIFHDGGLAYGRRIFACVYLRHFQRRDTIFNKPLFPNKNYFRFRVCVRTASDCFTHADLSPLIPVCYSM